MRTYDRKRRDRGLVVGIGRALAFELAEAGYVVGLAARRRGLLTELGAELPAHAYVARMDVADTADAVEGFRKLADAMGGIDLVVLSAGVGHENRRLEWEPERETIDVNVRGFAALATASMRHFEDRGEGHLVGISSVAARFGNGGAPAYSASKAFVSNYLEGLRYNADGKEANVTVTTIEPGFVDTEMAMGEDLFWMCSPETAAKQIRRAIEKNRSHAYVTRRWRLVSWLIRAMPEFVRKRMFF